MDRMLKPGWRTALIILFIAALSISVFSTPDGPSVQFLGNTTKTPGDAALVNTTGGTITTMVLNSTTQNLRWKAYVGNVTGTLTLQDASSYSIFDWSLTFVEGEIYATRASTSIDWSGVNCSTDANITNEEVAINHINNPNDNISSTFATKDHSEFYVGSNRIPNSQCYSLHTYKNGTSQSTDFEEILLNDGSNMVYATIIENDVTGFNPNSTFDFQMILPENGADNWDSSTAYYFYVELS